MHIIPAILEKTKEQVKDQINKLTPFFTHFQIDIADGLFVPNKTIQIKDIESLIKERQSNFKKITLDFHLMVNEYQSEIDTLLSLSQTVAIHTVFVHLLPFEKNKLKSDTLPFTLGIVLNPDDDLSTHWETVKSLKAIQIMSVQPGFQGAPFLPETLEKITELRKKEYTGEMYLDGGINEKTIPIILKNRSLPDALCIGSYLKEKIPQKIKILQSLTSPTTTSSMKDASSKPTNQQKKTFRLD